MGLPNVLSLSSPYLMQLCKICSVRYSTLVIVYPLLPPERQMSTILRSRGHNFKLPSDIFILHKCSLFCSQSSFQVIGLVCFISSFVFSTCVSYAEARLSYRLDVCPSVRLSVCPSVCLSHAGIVSKRLNILSCFLRHTIAHSF